MKEYANTWPRGGLFAFSGVDGETCHAEPFVAAGRGDDVGWDFWLEPRISLVAAAGEAPLTSRRHPDDYCFSDCWHCTVMAGERQGALTGGFVDRASFVAAVDVETGDGAVALSLRDAAGMPIDEPVYAGPGWWLAVAPIEREGGLQFGVAISYAGEAEARERAVAAAETDVAEIMLARLAFYDAAPLPDVVVGSSRRAYYKALSVMKVNTESAQADMPYRWTTPDRMPHRHMWLWDTAFHVAGLRYVAPGLAEDALRALFVKQHADGRLPLAAQPGAAPEDDRNLTGPESQPPVVAWAVWRLFEHGHNKDFLHEIYPKLVPYIEWFEANRKLENGLYGWAIRTGDDNVRGARGGESGMDNSPRFDDAAAITAVDLSCYMANEYAALEKLAEEAGKHAQARKWRIRRGKIAKAVNELLWDDEDRFYYDLDENGQHIPLKTTAGLLPLLAHTANRDRAEALRQHVLSRHEFWTPCPLPSVAIDEEAFSKDMWRGPAWMNMNVLVCEGLAAYGFIEETRSLARRSVEEITKNYLATGCFYEYYDALGETPPAELPRKGAAGAEGGAGFGVVADLNWTAAAFIHLVHETQ